MGRLTERLYNGIIKENPTFVMMLGMCPTLAVTSSAINGLGMGLSTTVVLILSNMLISALRKIIPDKVRIPAFIVIVASFVTIVQLLLQAYIPFLYSALGVYIPLIVVNCIILGRAESYASKNDVLSSAFDGIGINPFHTVLRIAFANNSVPICQTAGSISQSRQNPAIVVSCIHIQSQPDLFQIVGAGNAPRLFACLIQRRKKHRRQNRYNCYNDK